MQTVWKYPLAVADRQEISLPKSAKILTVHVQHSEPCLWALVDSDEPLEGRSIRIAGTGHPAENLGAYLGTFQLNAGALVFHVFEASHA